MAAIVSWTTAWASELGSLMSPCPSKSSPHRSQNELLEVSSVMSLACLASYCPENKNQMPPLSPRCSAIRTPAPLCPLPGLATRGVVRGPAASAAGELVRQAESWVDSTRHMEGILQIFLELIIGASIESCLGGSQFSLRGLSCLFFMKPVRRERDYLHESPSYRRGRRVHDPSSHGG